MSAPSIHLLGAILLTVGVLLLGLMAYYAHVMRLEILARAPKSRWNWLLVWISASSMHGCYYPDSSMRKKYYVSAIGMIVCIALGMRFWLVR
jgi:hypothetical protein